MSDFINPPTAKEALKALDRIAFGTNDNREFLADILLIEEVLTAIQNLPPAIES